MDLRIGRVSHSEENFIQRPKGTKQFIEYLDLQAVEY